MAMKIIFISGECAWAKLDTPDTKFSTAGVYTIDVFLDEANRQKFNEAGIQLKVKEKDGKTFATFRRVHSKLVKGVSTVVGPPPIHYADGTSLKGNQKIGNGSEVTLKISVYDTPKGKGSNIEAIRVDHLVPYEPVEVGTPDEGLPF